MEIFALRGGMPPPKPCYIIFKGLYLFKIDAVNQMSAEGEVTASIVPNPRVKVIPEQLDKVPTLLDIFEEIDSNHFVEFMLGVALNGSIDPESIVKQVHLVEGGNGCILIRARVVSDLPIPQVIDYTNSFTKQTYTQRYGNDHFFISGQEYDVLTQPITFTMLTMTHNNLIPSKWTGFMSSQIDWSVIYYEFIKPVELVSFQGSLETTNANAAVMKKYVEFNVVFGVSYEYDQLSVQMITYPKSILGQRVRFLPNEPDTVLLEAIPETFDNWRTVYGNLFYGLLPIVITPGGEITLDGTQYIYSRIDGNLNGCSNAWALMSQQTVRPNSMILFHEAGETNTIDVVVHFKDGRKAEFNASFYPFLQSTELGLSILPNPDMNFPFIIGKIICEFEEVLDDPTLLSHVIPNPAGHIFDVEWVRQLNRWMKLDPDEPWCLINMRSLPQRREYLVAVTRSPDGMKSAKPSKNVSQEEPSTNTTKPKKRWFGNG